MGTRADFYIGRGEEAEWLGSIAYDGYPEGWGRYLLEHDVEDEESFREAVKALFKATESGVGGGHWTSPEQGWPWPWEDSRTTDFSYAFDPEEGRIFFSCFGYAPWWPLEDYENYSHDDMGDEKTLVFPNMKDKQNVARDNRSGMLIVSVKD